MQRAAVCFARRLQGPWSEPRPRRLPWCVPSRGPSSRVGRGMASASRRGVRGAPESPCHATRAGRRSVSVAFAFATQTQSRLGLGLVQPPEWGDQRGSQFARRRPQMPDHLERRTDPEEFAVPGQVPHDRRRCGNCRAADERRVRQAAFTHYAAIAFGPAQAGGCPEAYIDLFVARNFLGIGRLNNSHPIGQGKGSEPGCYWYVDMMLTNLIVCRLCARILDDFSPSFAPSLPLVVRPLRNLVSYLKQKEAAGVISLLNKETEATGVLYAFPPCDFSSELLKRTCHNVTEDGLKEDHLVIVVVRGGTA